MRTLLTTALFVASTLVVAATLPYDELADAKADIQAALVQARNEGVLGREAIEAARMKPSSQHVCVAG